MAVFQLSTAYRDAAANLFETTLGTSAVLHLYAETVPANVAAANPATELVTVTLPSDWLAASSAGVKTLLGTWQAVSIATGTIRSWRLATSGGTVHAQGDVSVTGGGAVLTVDNTVVSIIGQQLTITAFTLTIGGA